MQTLILDFLFACIFPLSHLCEYLVFHIFTFISEGTFIGCDANVYKFLDLIDFFPFKGAIHLHMPFVLLTLDLDETIEVKFIVFCIFGKKGFDGLGSAST